MVLFVFSELVNFFVLWFLRPEIFITIEERSFNYQPLLQMKPLVLLLVSICPISFLFPYELVMICLRALQIMETWKIPQLYSPLYTSSTEVHVRFDLSLSDTCLLFFLFWLEQGRGFAKQHQIGCHLRFIHPK
jgi:hypothetical protein